MTRQGHVRVRTGVALSVAAFGLSVAIGAGQENGLLTGKVIDSVSSAPVSGATVILSSLSTGPIRERPRTDASGRFAVRVPTGRYEVTAAKAGVGEGALRQTDPMDPGGWISVSAGSSADVSIRLWRGGVISGRVMDGHAEGLGSVPVRLFKQAIVAGSVRLSAALSVTTDDRGAYRFPDVRPGTYVIGVLPMNASVPARGTADPSAETPSGLGIHERLALQEIPAFTAPLTFGSMRLSAAVDSFQPRRVNDTWVAPAAVFYPSTSDPMMASPIEVQSGREASAIDLTVVERPTVSVSGRLMAGGFALSPFTAVRLVPIEIASALGQESYSSLSLADDRGQFIFPVVARGRYQLLVHRTPSGPTDLGYWASEELNVQSDMKGLVIQLQAGLKITGRFDSGDEPTGTFEGARVRLERSDGAPSPRGLTLTVGLDGTFAVGGVPGGRYVLRFAGLGERAVSAVSSPVGELYSRAFDLRGEIENARASVTSARTIVRGVARDERGAPSGNCLVVLFPEDRRLWTDYGTTSVYLQSQRPSENGEFAFVGVPRGDYRLAAVGLGGKSQWSELTLLSALAPRASRLSLALGTTVTETLVILR